MHELWLGMVLSSRVRMQCKHGFAQLPRIIMLHASHGPPTCTFPSACPADVLQLADSQPHWISVALCGLDEPTTVAELESSLAKEPAW